MTILNQVTKTDSPQSGPVTKITLSVFSKTKGILTKRISLNDDGGLEKDASSCAMSHGSYQRQEVSDLGALNVLLDNLDRSQPSCSLRHCEQ